MQAFTPIQENGKWMIYDKVTKVSYKVTPNTKEQAVKRCKELNELD